MAISGSLSISHDLHFSSVYTLDKVLDKVSDDQIDDKFIPTALNPYPVAIPGFYDQYGMPCNPYMQTAYIQPPIVGYG